MDRSQVGNKPLWAVETDNANTVTRLQSKLQEIHNDCVMFFCAATNITEYSFESEP